MTRFTVPRILRGEQGWSRVRWIAAGTVLLGILFAAGWVRFYQPEVQHRQALLDASGPHRIFEARLTGDREHRPFLSSTQSSLVQVEVMEARFVSLAVQTLGTADGDLLRLMRGGLELPADRRRNLSRIEGSLRALRNVSDAAPEDEQKLNDLAAAQLFAAEVLGDPLYRVEALETLDRAVASKPEFEEALFNRALALKGLYLFGESRAAWERYLQVDFASPWASEARELLADLDSIPEGPGADFQIALETALDDARGSGHLESLQALVSRDFQGARELGEQFFLSHWASALQEDGEPSGRWLERAVTLGAVLADTSGDHLLSEAAAAVLRLQEARDRLALVALATAHLDLKTGLEMVEKKRFSASFHHFEAADSGLSAAGSPLAGWARYYRAFEVYLASDYDATLQLLDEIEALGQLGRYPSLVGRTLRFRGLVQEILGNHSEALGLYRRSHGLFESLGESGNLASVSTDLAGTLASLGEEAEAWSFRLRALGTQRRDGDANRLCATYSESARSLRRQGKSDTALLFQQEAVRLAKEGQAWPSAVGALRSMAALESALGRDRDGLESIEEARALAEAHLEGAEQRLAFVDIDKVHGRLLVSTDPQGAVDLLTSAVEGHRETDYRYVLPSVLLSRAEIQRSLGRYTESEADLQEAFGEVERQRTEVAAGQQRVSYFDQVQDLYEELVLLLEEQGRLQEAFAMDEAARARVLLDWSRELEAAEEGSPPEEPDFGDVSAVLGYLALISENAVVLQLRVFENRLLIWVLGQGEIERVWVEVGAEELTRKVRELRQAIHRPSEGAFLKEAASSLFQVLVEPVQGHLGEVTRLILVPHGPLHEVPFAALFDGDRQRYLVEDYVLSVSPSLASLRSTRGDLSGTTARPEGKALVVGDPAIDRRRFPLPALPAARLEAEQVADLYGPSSELLLGQDATPAAFLAAITSAELIHIAAHAQPDEANPLDSRILLARDDTGDGRLEVRDLLGLDLRRTRLVVLSACETALGSSSKSEGIQNLARPFLAAGVPSVVATLWSIEDGASPGMMVRFHQYIHQGLGAAEALQQTQLEALAATAPNGVAAEVWAAFEVVGGGL